MTLIDPKAKQSSCRKGNRHLFFMYQDSSYLMYRFDACFCGVNDSSYPKSRHSSNKSKDKNANDNLPLERKIDLAKSYYSLGEDFFEKGLYSDAIDALEYSVNLYDGLTDSHFLLGTCLHYLGRLEQAEVEYVKTIDLNPYHAKAHYNYANILQDRCDSKGAIKHFLTATQINPLDADTLVSLGLAYKQDGNIHEAIRCCIDGINLDCSNIFGVYNLAVIYQDLGQMEDAVTQYLRVLQLDHDHIDSYVNLSLIYQDIAMRETMPKRLEYLISAYKCYERIEALDPTIVEVQRASRKLKDTISFYQMFNDEDEAAF